MTSVPLLNTKILSKSEDNPSSSVITSKYLQFVFSNMKSTSSLPPINGVRSKKSSSPVSVTVSLTPSICGFVLFVQLDQFPVNWSI